MELKTEGEERREFVSVYRAFCSPFSFSSPPLLITEVQLMAATPYHASFLPSPRLFPSVFRVNRANKQTVSDSAWKILRFRDKNGCWGCEYDKVTKCTIVLSDSPISRNWLKAGCLWGGFFFLKCTSRFGSC